MNFTPHYLTTLIGSVPYTDTTATCQHLVNGLDIPIWPQMVKLGVVPDIVTDQTSAHAELNG